MAKRVFLLHAIILLSGVLWAGEIVLVGKYSGKDIYVQNPYNSKEDTYCTSAVFVNDRKVKDYPEASAYTVTLSHLNMGDLVVLRIEHSNHCKPVVVNPQVINHKEGFEFTLEQVDNNNITWHTKGEDGGGIFTVERLNTKTKIWEVVKEVVAKGEPEMNQYSISPNHKDGVNEYFVKFKDNNGSEFASIKLMFTYTDDPVKFSPRPRVGNKIKLSKSIPFIITDMNGNKVKEGVGKTIMVQDLKPGLYFLNIQHRTERFVKI